MAVQFEAVCTKVHVFSRRCRRPLEVVNALDRLSISCLITKIYRPLNLPLSREFVQKVVLCPRF